MWFAIWLLIAALGGGMANPILSRVVTAGDLDMLDQTIRPIQYQLEWLRPNYFSDPSFEGGSFVDWDNNVNAAVNMASARSGAYGVELSGIAAIGQSTAQFAPVLPGTVYVLSGWAKLAAGSPNILPSIGFYDASFAFISSDSTTTALTSSWAQYSHTSAAAPANAAWAQRGFSTATPGASVYLDDVAFTPYLLDHDSSALPTVTDFALLQPSDEETFTFPEEGEREIVPSYTPSRRVNRLASGQFSQRRSFGGLKAWDYRNSFLDTDERDQLIRFLIKLHDTGRQCFYTDAQGVKTQGYIPTDPRMAVEGRTGEFWSVRFRFEEAAVAES